MSLTILTYVLTIFFAYFLSELIMHGHIREKRNIHLCKLKHPNFAVPKHTNVIHVGVSALKSYCMMLCMTLCMT